MQINSTVQATDYQKSFEKVATQTSPVEAKPQKEPVKEVKVEQQPQKLDELKTVFEESNISLNFSRDEKTQSLVVKLVDKVTGEAIRQIPSEVSLKLAAVNAKLQGNFVDQKS
ncbi:MAG: flagellar protein FlaG [Pyrinomonadaceae bacterium]